MEKVHFERKIRVKTYQKGIPVMMSGLSTITIRKFDGLSFQFG